MTKEFKDYCFDHGTMAATCHICGCKKAEFLHDENHVECPRCFGYKEEVCDSSLSCEECIKGGKRLD